MKRGKIIIIISATLLILSCIHGDPEYFIRNGYNRVSFKTDTGFNKSFRYNNSGNPDYLTIQGLLVNRVSKCGKAQTLTLRIIPDSVHYLEQIKIFPKKISVLYQDSLLDFQSIDTTYKPNRNTELALDMVFGGDTCRTVSVFKNKIDTINAEVKIAFNEALQIENKSVSMDTLHIFDLVR